MTRTAIVGLACLFPGAPDLDSFWRNIVEGVDAISDVPAERWDASFYDPASNAVDRFYCKRGGFVDRDATFDPLAFGIVPNAVDSIEPEQLLTLKVGFEALRDAGYEERPFPRERTGVIVGRGNYSSAGALRLDQHVRMLPQILRTLRDLFPGLSDAALEAARDRLRQQLSHYGPDVAAGLIPNLVASRLANRLDLHGPAFTVDAACASSAIAIEQACMSLSRGETDMMLVGGAHLTHDLTFWATFSQLGALSRSGVSRPLSADADGILAGEGVGVAVLKRLDDALAAGDRIYAVIEGTGSSSDGRGASLVAPATNGQLIALNKAWSGVPFERTQLGLIETHGTGTPTGDQVELETLAQFFGEHAGNDARAVAGSVKSMIGHAMPASGMASLIKTALSIYHGVLPPTLHCETPHPQLARTRFRVTERAESWQQPREDRIAAFNTFGFGGINGHVILRGMPERQPATATTGISPSLPPVLLLSADSAEALLARFDRGEQDSVPGQGSCRLAIIAPDAKKLATARKAIASGKPWQGRQQIWFSPDGLIGAGGKLAFVFPGVDSRFAPRAGDIAAHFGLHLPAYCEPYDPAEALPYVVRGVLGFNLLMFDALSRLGIRAEAMAGHSIGEWSAITASGMVARSEAEKRYAAGDPRHETAPDLPYLAAACDEQRLRELLTGLENIDISHDNCPHQAIACGERSSIERALLRLREARIFAQILPMVAGFHSPLFAPHSAPYREAMAELPMAEPAVPVWSIVSADPFPADADERRELASRQLLEPVRFRPLIDSMYEAGCRVFIQVGTGSLGGFIDDTLSDRPHHAIDSHSENRSGLEQLQVLSAALWVEGAEFDNALLGGALAPRRKESASSATARQLSLGVPLLRVREPLDPGLLPASFNTSLSSGVPPAAEDDAVGQLLRETLADIERAGRDVLAMWHQHRSGAQRAPARVSPSINVRLRKLLDLDSTIPWVKDHMFYPQRAGWPIVADGRPVVPLTMEVMLVREALENALAERGLADLKVIEVRDIKAYNWLEVAEPVSIEIVLQSSGDFAFDTEIAGYFSARLIVAPLYPAASSVGGEPAPIANSRPTHATAADLYRDGWMFHGPAYQGVSRFDGIGDNGIDGELRVPTGSGALLDNMGQLAGYWVMEQPDNCLAMPVGVDRIRFFGPDPLPGETLHAQVRVVRLDELNCVTDHVLRDASGAVRIVIDGWQTRRYHMDHRFWTHIRQIWSHEVSQFVPPNVAIFEDRYDTALMRDYICRRYLTAEERRTYDELPPRRRREWLNGRVAAKDAVRGFLRRERGKASIYPQELRIENDGTGAPRVRPNVTDTVPDSLHVSLSHKDRFAVAIAGERPVGIDIERIETRTQGFADLAFSQQEQALFAGEAFDIACTRAWVVKEVAAKARGTGLQGRLREYVVDRRDGDCFRVNGRWVVTHRLDNYIVGWLLDVPNDGAPDGAESFLQSTAAAAVDA
jgi:acyl transferase domain-containing protein/phosphopantetheinyl transferase